MQKFILWIDRHADLTQEDIRTALGNDLFTSLHEVSLEASTSEASIEHVSDLESNGMDSLCVLKAFSSVIVDSQNVTSPTQKEKTLDQEKIHSTPLSLHVDHTIEEITVMDQPIKDVEDMVQEYDRYSDFYNRNHIPSLHEVTSSYKDDSTIEFSIDGAQKVGVTNGICVVNSRHEFWFCISDLGRIARLFNDEGRWLLAIA